MTRKCILCKETNYKNAYSFFSAPKDPELRKKWQNAIAIENYCVSDDTYVCSKHFHKDDIITHWVSGVPPHVISIKYKKCRLRPGAVPGRNFHLERNANDQGDSDDFDTNTNSPFKLKRANSPEDVGKQFLISKTETKLQGNNDDSCRITSSHHQLSHEFNDSSKKRKEFNDSNKNLSNKIELLGNGSTTSNTLPDESRSKDSLERNLKQTKESRVIYLEEDSITSNTHRINDMSSKDKKEEQRQTCEEDFYSNKSKKILESSTKLFNVSNGDSTHRQLWEVKTVKEDAFSEERLTDDFKVEENSYERSELGNNLNYGQLDTCYPAYNDIEENEMLFEDLLEVSTEVLLPRGWSCLVTSKGHTTTIVYLYMGMTKGGMPFTEKQVFIKSDMILHCAIVNTEIDLLVHNLIREGKQLKVQSLLDIEELIDEFDQRIICQGIYNTEGFQEMRDIKTAYKDGIKWRHVLCPLIINNDSSRCTRCASLSRSLQRKSKNSFPSSYNPIIFTKKQQKAYTIRQKCKRTRRHEHRYEFKNV